MTSSNVAQSNEGLKDLFRKALLVRERAHVPYSHYKVGAALRTKDGKVFDGCNVENSSYGGSVCAERVAMLKAVSELTVPLEVSEILVVTDATPPWPPCGMCRQVLAEFTGNGNPRIHLCNPEGMLETYEFSELFPKAFTPAHLV